MKHSFVPNVYYNTFGPHEGVLQVASGDTISTTTLCAQGIDQHGVKVAERGNPLTGPFYVEGAEPGDCVRIDIHSIVPNRQQGWTRTVVASHVVDADYVKELPDDIYATWNMDLSAGTATLVEPDTSLGRLTLELDPMLGCLGVAPRGHQAIVAATSAEHGGNMDYRGTRAGSSFYFPVFEPGALIFVGDGHAVQGDGEIVGTGIEISMDVSFTVTLIKEHPIGWPRGENAEWMFTLGNARPLDQALQHATTEMLRWLIAESGMDARAASILLGQVVRYEVGNVFDPAYTMVCKVPKNLI